MKSPIIQIPNKQSRLKTIGIVIGITITLAWAWYLANQNHNYFEKAIVSQAQAQLLSTTRSEAQSIGQYLSNVIGELEILSNQEVIKRGFLDKYSNETTGQFSLLHDSYEDIKSVSDSLLMIDTKAALIYGVASQEGTIGTDLSQEPDIQTALSTQKFYVSGSFVISGKYLVAVDQPVFVQDRFIGILRATINLEKLNALQSRRVEKENWYTFLIDAKGILLNYTDAGYIGKNITSLFNKNQPSSGQCEISGILKQMRAGKEGVALCKFPALGNTRNMSDRLIAYAPVRLGQNVWFMTAVMNYDSIAGPVNENARDTFVFAGFVVFVLCISGGIFYWHQKQRADEIHFLYATLAKNHEELQLAQSLLIQAEKMQIVGKLASGVAHEVKNPLAVIQLGVEYLKEKVHSEDTNVSLFLNDIETSVTKADTIIKGLLNFSSSGKLDMKPADMHSIIEVSLALLKNLCDSNHINVIKEFDHAIPLVNVDRNKIEQVFVNLILNAIQAMPNGGDLLIRTAQSFIPTFKNRGSKAADEFGISPQRGRATGTPGFSTEGSIGKGKTIQVQIEDTGSGIRESDMKNLFEPFFTTKRAIGGTGLGLSIVKNIVEMHRGKIVIANKKEGKGVKVTVTFKV